MSSYVYQYNETVQGFELHIGPFSLLEAASLINKKTKLSITSLGATCYKKFGWATEQEIPIINNIESLIVFLEAEGDIGLIEFEATLSGIGRLSISNDQCCFLFKTKQQCLSLIKAVAPPQYSALLINKLINNQRLYLECNSKGEIMRYDKYK